MPIDIHTQLRNMEHYSEEPEVITVYQMLQELNNYEPAIRLVATSKSYLRFPPPSIQLLVLTST
jgi:hypothetical protein